MNLVAKIILIGPFYIFSPTTYKIICENITCKINGIKNPQFKLSRLIEGKLLVNIVNISKHKILNSYLSKNLYLNKKNGK